MRIIFENSELLSVSNGVVIIKKRDCDVIHRYVCARVEYFDDKNGKIILYLNFFRGQMLKISCDGFVHYGLYDESNSVFFITLGCVNSEYGRSYFSLKDATSLNIERAKPEEIEMFHENCKKDGKRFNFQTFEFEDL